jgi:glycosyltransferase involved in cell wall biosynthesis
MERKIYFNLTPLAITSAGSAVYAWELCHRLMRLAQPTQVIPYSCPFVTINKTGIVRILNAILRENIWHPLLAGLGDKEQDYFICPTHNVPKSFYHRQYAIVILDLAAWHDSSVTTWGGRNFAKSLPESIKKASHIFAISDYTAQDVANEFCISRERIIVAPCGLSEIYKKNVEILRRVNDVELPDQYFLHVGSFDPKKNLAFLIKVYERFREVSGDEGQSVKLILTGGESFKNMNVSLIENIHNSPYKKEIIILGKVKSEELPSLYKTATAFIFPSTFEGFGIPVIEALSQGTPVLVNANTSLTQFKEFGATVFDNFDVDIWANELRFIVQNGQRVPASYVLKIKDYFDWDRTAQIVAQAIELVTL